MHLEKKLYGDAKDPPIQYTGINFEKYDDILVKATGAGVPKPIITFMSPPLDPVTAGQDLMACAQVHATGVSSMLLF